MSERSRWLLPVLLSMLFVYQMRSARRWSTFATIPISLRFSDRDRALGSASVLIYRKERREVAVQSCAPVIGDSS